MNRPAADTRNGARSRGGLLLLAAGVTAALAILGPGLAFGSWNKVSSGQAKSKADTLAAGNTPSASVSNRQVAVSWSATGGSVPPGGYLIKRYNGAGDSQVIGASCSGTITATSCTEANVPPGTWRYSVTPKEHNWQGAESDKSSPATVSAGTLTMIGSTTLTSLPAAMTATLTNFIPGQTVSFRLDDPDTGPTLTGSITPTPVPITGTAAASLTIPSGTANGAHTVYAIGSLGDVASASITVAVPVSLATSSWSVGDASSGTLQDRSDPLAFAADGLNLTTANFGSSFSASRYESFDFNAPLGPLRGISDAEFKLNFAGSTGGATTCFYFEVRKISDDQLIAAHGSSGTPVGCASGTTTSSISTPIPEVTTSEIVNDLRIRAYFSSSTSGPAVIGRAVVEATADGAQAFTLYEDSYTDRASGSGSAQPWPLQVTDAIRFTSASGWPLAANSSRYLKFSFPAYVPTGATVTAATFRHTYRSTLGTSCYYFEVLSGSTVLATHGSSGSPVSCSTSLSNQVDQIALPEVTTVNQANNLSVKLYFNNVGLGGSRHDLSRLDLSYAP